MKDENNRDFVPENDDMRMLLYICMVLCPFLMSPESVPQERPLVVFWNLENFFDFRNDGHGDSDRDFSPEGRMRWTPSRFYAKVNAVAKSFLWMESEYGRLPDVIGLAEIENRFVLKAIVSTDAMKKKDFGIIHCESGDRRGIDVALLYNRKTVSVTDFSVYKVRDSCGTVMDTRDILAAVVEMADDTLCFIVNHHPSKYGGERKSSGKRMAAMETMLGLADSLIASGYRRIVSMGDFNDVPDGPAMMKAGRIFLNKGMYLHEIGKGSIRYQGKWELIDNFLVYPDSDTSVMKICRVPFLMEKDAAHGGYRPLRTYTGPRYTGGASDHCPIVLFL